MQEESRNRAPQEKIDQRMDTRREGPVDELERWCRCRLRSSPSSPSPPSSSSRSPSPSPPSRQDGVWEVREPRPLPLAEEEGPSKRMRSVSRLLLRNGLAAP